jgi:uncharacterized membrane protein YedE/YeeE
MTCPIIPAEMIGPEAGLLTALFIGFFFGFALERAGFGNSRKLAAQFYLYDMTVFKVMFTAIIVAMTGLFAFDAWGLVNLDQVWINPTWLWPQLIGGFLLGVGFIVSGLCPGTSVVAAASGRLDGVATIGGVFIGTFIWSLLVDTVPVIDRLYHSGEFGRILLSDLIGLGAPWVALMVLLMALGGFIGAEKVERIFQTKLGVGLHSASGFEKSPRNPVIKLALIGTLVVVIVIAGFSPPGVQEQTSPLSTPVTAMELADLILTGHPNLLLIDLRTETGIEDTGQGNQSDQILPTTIPGALGGTMADPGSLKNQVENAGQGVMVVLFNETGGYPATLSPELPPDAEYRYLQGGFAAWRHQILTPVVEAPTSLEQRQEFRRRNAITSFFTGSEAKAEVAAPPPPVPTGGGNKKKKADGGC